MSKKSKTPDLSTAKVGDNLWDSFERESVTIYEILLSHQYPIRFRYRSGVAGNCALDGRWEGDHPDGLARYYWQPFDIPDECLTRPEDPLLPNGTLCWGKNQYEDDDQWGVGYLQREGKYLYLSRTPTDTTWLSVDQITTENPYVKGKRDADLSNV